MIKDSAADPRHPADALDDYVARVLSDQDAAIPPGLGRDEVSAYLLAARMAGTRSGYDDPSPEMLSRLRRRVEAARPERTAVPGDGSCVSAR